MQIATAMHQMTATVVEVSGNSNRAAEVARQSAEMANRGGEDLENTLKTMNVISNAVSSTGKQVDDWAKGPTKSAASPPSLMRSPTRPICWPSTPPSKQPARVNRGAGLRW